MLKGQAREDSKPNRNPKTRVYWVGSNQQKTSQQTHGAPMGYGGKSRPLAPKKQAQGGLGYSGAATRKASARTTHARVGARIRTVALQCEEAAGSTMTGARTQRCRSLN